MSREEEKDMLAEHLNVYIKQKRSQEECIGFIDGFNKALEVVKANSVLGDVSKSFYCETKRGCLEQCDDCALTELVKDMAC